MDDCCKKVVSEIVARLKKKSANLKASAMLCYNSDNERSRMKMSELFSDMADEVESKYLKTQKKEDPDGG